VALIKARTQNELVLDLFGEGDAKEGVLRVDVHCGEKQPVLDKLAAAEKKRLESSPKL
jgi:hypothetical protein